MSKKYNSAVPCPEVMFIVIQTDPPWRLLRSFIGAEGWPLHRDCSDETAPFLGILEREEKQRDDGRGYATY